MANFPKITIKYIDLDTKNEVIGSIFITRTEFRKLRTISESKLGGLPRSEVGDPLIFRSLFNKGLIYMSPNNLVCPMEFVNVAIKSGKSNGSETLNIEIDDILIRGIVWSDFL